MGKKFKILFAVSFALLLLISFSSAVTLYEKKDKVQDFFSKKVGIDPVSRAEANVYWAKEIMNGGYILHFRHAERDKWIDVQMYDALESDLHSNGKNESRYGENDYFDKAVCLNDRGKIQAKAIGESLKHIDLPIGAVHSSVSCRARQTADLSFGGYDQLHRILVHAGPYNEEEEIRVEKLKILYSSFAEIDGKNAIVSAHNSVISCDMFINTKCPSDLHLEEGGFYVLRNTKDGLLFEHEFHFFYEFNLVFYER
jgi:phosphohistidine phosphatase SixA